MSASTQNSLGFSGIVPDAGICNIAAVGLVFS